MLPLLPQSLPELDASAELLPGNPAQAIDFGPFAAVFTDVLRAPILAGQADIESPHGQLLPENGNPLPPPVISVGLPSPLTPKNSGNLQQRVMLLGSHLETTHPAQSGTNMELRIARETDLHARRDEGLARLTFGSERKQKKPDAAASNKIPAARSPIPIAYSADRRLTGMPVPIEVPIIDVPTAAPKSQPAHFGAQFTAATPQLVMSPVPELEPIELRSQPDGQNASVQLTPAVSSATVAGNTTPSINWPGTAPVTSMASTPAQLVIDINIPVLDPQWGTMLNERVTWMASRNIQNAEIRMSPPELGPLRVQVSIDEGSAQVNFDAQHAMTREAIELALPRLREMLSENGLLLTDVSVSDQEVNHGQEGVGHDANSEVSSADGSQGEGEDLSDPAIAGSRAKSGIVDTFV